MRAEPGSRAWRHERAFEREIRQLARRAMPPSLGKLTVLREERLVLTASGRVLDGDAFDRVERWVRTGTLPPRSPRSSRQRALRAAGTPKTRAVTPAATVSATMIEDGWQLVDHLGRTDTPQMMMPLATITDAADVPLAEAVTANVSRRWGRRGGGVAGIGHVGLTAAAIVEVRDLEGIRADLIAELRAHGVTASYVEIPAIPLTASVEESTAMIGRALTLTGLAVEDMPTAASGAPSGDVEHQQVQPAGLGAAAQPEPLDRLIVAAPVLALIRAHAESAPAGAEVVGRLDVRGDRATAYTPMQNRTGEPFRARFVASWKPGDQGLIVHSHPPGTSADPSALDIAHDWHGRPFAVYHVETGTLGVFRVGDDHRVSPVEVHGG